MNGWLLVIILNSGSIFVDDFGDVTFYETKQECFDVLDRVKISEGENNLAYCRPGEKGIDFNRNTGR